MLSRRTGIGNAGARQEETRKEKFGNQGTLAYTIGEVKFLPRRTRRAQGTCLMRKPRDKSKPGKRPEWANAIARLRERLKLNQTSFGEQLHSSAMAVSRWERGAQEPPSHSYIELGNLSGDPECWYFWGCAGLRNEDLMRVLPKMWKRMRNSKLDNYSVVRAGSSGKKTQESQLVAIPMLDLVAGTHGENGDTMPMLHDAPVQSMIAAPKDWCPNPSTTCCLRVQGDSMTPLINDKYIVVVDSSQNDRTKLNDKIVIAWHKNTGLTVSRFRRYDHTEVLHPENRAYESITMDRKNHWRVLARVLWWIGKAP